MFCPKCKNLIADDVIKCPICSCKVKIICPACKSLNRIGSTACAACSLALLKYCTNCRSANLPTAKVCRKCSAEFNVKALSRTMEFKQDALPSIQKYTPETDSRPELIQSQKPSQMPIVEPQEEFTPEPVQEVEQEPLQESPAEQGPVQEPLYEAGTESEKGFESEPEIESMQEIIQEPEPESMREFLSELTPELIPEPFYESEQTEEVQQEPVQDYEIASSAEEVFPFEEQKEPVSQNLGEILLGADYEVEQEEIKTQEEEYFASAEDLNLLPDNEEIVEETDHKAEEEQEIFQSESTEEPFVQAEEAYEQKDEIEQQVVESEITDVEEAKTEEDIEIVEKEQPEEAQDEEITYKDQMDAKDAIVKAIENSEKFVIGLGATEGLGKTLVLKHVFDEIQNYNYTWLWGECSMHTQLSPFGAIQDILLTYLNLPSVCNNTTVFKKETKRFFETNFPALNSEETAVLINSLYPEKVSYYENILENKTRTFEVLEKVFCSIKENEKVIFVIDDFDFVDGASYEFITSLVDKGFADENFKIIITYKDARAAQGYLYSPNLYEQFYENVFLGDLSNNQIDSLIGIFMGNNKPLPPEITEQIYKNAQGSPTYVEQVISFLSEINALKLDSEGIAFDDAHINTVIPRSIVMLIKTKLGLLKTNHPEIYNLVCFASLLGSKFSINALQEIAQLESDVYEECLETLSYLGYFARINNSTLVFKNTVLWKECLESTKIDEDFRFYNKRILETLQTQVISNNSLRALLEENLEQKENSFEMWTQSMRLAACIGDFNLYVISQKQCLKLLEEVEIEDSKMIMNNIHERIGKVLHKTSPEQAVGFLSNAIITAKENNDFVKVIELASYIAISASRIGNFLGIIEIVDLVTSILDKDVYPVEVALIKQKKLRALCQIGNCEEVVNLAGNEILPILREIVTKPSDKYSANLSIIYESWLEANLTMAFAYIIQGNMAAGIDLLQKIEEIVQINNLESIHYLSRLKIGFALAYSLQGDIDASEQVLKDIISQFGNDTLEHDVVSQWNLIQILNKMFTGNMKNIKEELFSVVTFANNNSDEFTKNLLKTFLGKIISDEGNTTRAMEIYDEQVTYFAKEKNAIGALLCWYYIVQGTLLTEGPDKALDIAQKALDVSKNPKINNYYFMIMLKTLIAEIYIIKDDLDATKMYIEKAIMLSKKYGLNYLRAKLYLLYAKYFEELISKNPDELQALKQNVEKNHEKAIKLADEAHLEYLADEINEAKRTFETFCQLSGSNNQ